MPPATKEALSNAAIYQSVCLSYTHPYGKNGEFRHVVTVEC